jgi:hypothetical protein
MAESEVEATGKVTTPTQAGSRPVTQTTPIKYTTQQGATGNKLDRDFIIESVMKDVENNIYVTDTTNFIGKKFPFKHKAEQVFESFEKEGLYDGVNWANTPPNKALENEYYSFLVQKAESIRLKYMDIYKPRKLNFNSRWVQVDNRIPQTGEKYSASVRPDIMSLIASEKEAEEWKSYQKNIKELVSERFCRALASLTVHCLKEEELKEKEKSQGKKPSEEDKKVCFRVLTGRLTC